LATKIRQSVVVVLMVALKVVYSVEMVARIKSSGTENCAVSRSAGTNEIWWHHCQQKREEAFSNLLSAF
jgi:hypothetical protein